MNRPLGPIEHVIVLMFENRSFDNLFGGLYPGKPQSEFLGLVGTESIPSNPYDSASPRLSVWQADPGPGSDIMPYPDPGELFSDMNQQIYAPDDEAPTCRTPANMYGYAYNYSLQQPGHDGKKPVPRDILQYYRTGAEGDVPVSSTLARAFGVSDLWFASGPVQTLANRIFAHCGTPSTYRDSEGVLHAVVDNSDIKFLIDPDASVTATPVFHLLDQAAGRWPHPAWRVYFHDWPLSAFIKYVDDRWHYLAGGNVSRISQFFTDIGHELPTYCFIEPRYTGSHFLGIAANSNHPGGSSFDGGPPAISILDGEQLLYDIVAALLQVPDVFQKTLLIVTYDEHGGLYDHVPPPCAVSPFGPGEVVGFRYDRYGARVPAIFVNPHVQPGTTLRPSASGAVFDHTSLISTLRAQFDLGGPMTPRDAAAPVLSGLIDESAPLNPFRLEDLPKPQRRQTALAAVPQLSIAARTDPNALHAVIRRAMDAPRNKDRADFIRAQDALHSSARG
jgi:phospholipase C